MFKITLYQPDIRTEASDSLQLERVGRLCRYNDRPNTPRATTVSESLPQIPSTGADG